MGRRKTTPKRLLERFAVAEDLVSLRRKLFGDRGAEEMARILGLSTRTWHNFEHGCLVPAEVVLKLLTLFPREASFGPLLDMKEPAHLAGTHATRGSAFQATSSNGQERSNGTRASSATAPRTSFS